MLNVDFEVAILLVEVVIPLVLPPIERLSIIVGELFDIEAKINIILIECG